MSKRTIGILYVISIIIWIGALVGLLSVMGNYTAAQTQVASDQKRLASDQRVPPFLNANPTLEAVVQKDQEALRNDQKRVTDAESQLAVVVVSMIVASIPGMIAWIGTLVNLSRAQAWTMFVLTFFFGGIMLLIYLLRSSTTAQSRATSTATAGTGYVAPGSYPGP